MKVGKVRDDLDPRPSRRQRHFDLGDDPVRAVGVVDEVHVVAAHLDHAAVPLRPTRLRARRCCRGRAGCRSVRCRSRHARPPTKPPIVETRARRRMHAQLPARSAAWTRRSRSSARRPRRARACRASIAPRRAPSCRRWRRLAAARLGRNCRCRHRASSAACVPWRRRGLSASTSALLRGLTIRAPRTCPPPPGA